MSFILVYWRLIILSVILQLIIIENFLLITISVVGFCLLHRWVFPIKLHRDNLRVKAIPIFVKGRDPFEDRFEIYIKAERN